MIQTITVMIVATTIFYFGFLLGYKVANKTEIAPEIKVEKIKEKIPFTRENREQKEELREEEMKMNELNNLLKNVNNYVGDDEGQRRIK